MKNLFVRKKGTSLVWAVIFVGILSTISISVSTLTVREIRMSADQDFSEKAYSAARSGLEVGEYLCTRGHVANFKGYLESDISYDLKIVPKVGGGGCEIESIGKVESKNSVTRKLIESYAFDGNAAPSIADSDLENPHWYDSSGKYDTTPSSYERTTLYGDKRGLIKHGNLNYEASGGSIVTEKGTPFKFTFDYSFDKNNPNTADDRFKFFGVAEEGLKNVGGGTDYLLNQYFVVGVKVQGNLADTLYYRLKKPGQAVTETLIGNTGSALRVSINYTGARFKVCVKNTFNSQILHSFTVDAPDFYFNRYVSMTRMPTTWWDNPGFLTHLRQKTDNYVLSGTNWDPNYKELVPVVRIPYSASQNRTWTRYNYDLKGDPTYGLSGGKLQGQCPAGFMTPLVDIYNEIDLYLVGKGYTRGDSNYNLFFSFYFPSSSMEYYHYPSSTYAMVGGQPIYKGLNVTSLGKYSIGDMGGTGKNFLRCIELPPPTCEISSSAFNKVTGKTTLTWKSMYAFSASTTPTVAAINSNYQGGTLEVTPTLGNTYSLTVFQGGKQAQCGTKIQRQLIYGYGFNGAQKTLVFRRFDVGSKSWETKAGAGYNGWFTSTGDDDGYRVSLAVLDGLIYGYGSGGFNVYDPATNTWTDLPDVPLASNGLNKPVALVGYNHKIYGYINNDFNSDFAVYDPVTQTWNFLASPGEANTFAALTELGGKIYFAGVLRIKVYDIDLNSWVELPSDSMTRGSYNSALTATADTLYSYGAGADAKNFKAYYPEINSWVGRADLGFCAFGVCPLGMVSIDGKVYLHGMDGFKVYDPTLNSWSDLVMGFTHGSWYNYSALGVTSMFTTNINF